ncbi:hypothetical protein V8D89_002758, partial [Ganoderma adspersum]
CRVSSKDVSYSTRVYVPNNTSLLRTLRSAKNDPAELLRRRLGVGHFDADNPTNMAIQLRRIRRQWRTFFNRSRFQGHRCLSERFAPPAPPLRPVCYLGCSTSAGDNASSYPLKPPNIGPRLPRFKSIIGTCIHRGHSRARNTRWSHAPMNSRGASIATRLQTFLTSLDAYASCLWYVRHRSAIDVASAPSARPHTHQHAKSSRAVTGDSPGHLALPVCCQLLSLSPLWPLPPPSSQHSRVDTDERLANHTISSSSSPSSPATNQPTAYRLLSPLISPNLLPSRVEDDTS